MVMNTNSSNHMNYKSKELMILATEEISHLPKETEEKGDLKTRARSLINKFRNYLNPYLGQRKGSEEKRLVCHD